MFLFRHRDQVTLNEAGEAFVLGLKRIEGQILENQIHVVIVGIACREIDSFVLELCQAFGGLIRRRVEDVGLDAFGAFFSSSRGGVQVNREKEIRFFSISDFGAFAQAHFAIGIPREDHGIFFLSELAFQLTGEPKREIFFASTMRERPEIVSTMPRVQSDLELLGSESGSVRREGGSES